MTREIGSRILAISTVALITATCGIALIYGLKNPAEAAHDLPGVKTVKQQDTHAQASTLHPKTIHHSDEAIHPASQITQDQLHHIPPHLHPFSHDPAIWTNYHDDWADPNSGHYHDPNYLGQHQEYVHHLDELHHHHPPAQYGYHDPYGHAYTENYYAHDPHMQEQYYHQQEALHSPTQHQPGGVITTAALGPHVASLPSANAHVNDLSTSNAHAHTQEQGNLAQISPAENASSSITNAPSNHPEPLVKSNTDNPSVNALNQMPSIESTATNTAQAKAQTSSENDVLFDPLPGIFPAERVSRVIKDRTLDITVHGDRTNPNRGKVFIFRG